MAKTKPNEPCPCGSGKKFKKCCVNKKNLEDAQHQEEQNHVHNGYQRPATQEEIWKTIIARATPQGEIAHERKFAHEFGFLDAYLQVLDKYVPKVFQDWGGDDDDVDLFPAVDFASGAGVFPFAYAKHFQPRNSKYPLKWYPSEYTAPPIAAGDRIPLQELQKCFQVMMDEELKPPQGRLAEDLVAADANKNAMFANDLVKLDGLSKQSFTFSQPREAIFFKKGKGLHNLTPNRTLALCDAKNT